jgi:hypothetical protein
MRRSTVLAALLLVLPLARPLAAEAQVHPMAGVGLSTPFGDFGDAAETGWHGTAGLQLSVPAIPIALRADGGYHSFGQATGAPAVSMLAGSLSLVLNLPGVGLVPYVLGGLGTYRRSVDVSGVEPVSNNGVHGAFGVNIGAIGFGGFGEVRVVNVNSSGGDSRFVTATLGLRL